MAIEPAEAAPPESWYRPEASASPACAEHKDSQEALLATGLEQAGAIAKVKVVDAYGRYLRLCRAKAPVGWYNTHGTLVSTRCFVVVTSKLVEDGAVEHDIRTAYPVSEQW